MKRVEEDENSIENLEQLVKSLEEAGAQLEKAYKQKDSERFNKLKKIMLQLQQQILEGIK